MKSKLFAVTLLGLAVATTVALTGCKAEDTTTNMETPDANVEAPATTTEATTTTTETTAAPAAEGEQGAVETTTTSTTAAPEAEHH